MKFCLLGITILLVYSGRSLADSNEDSEEDSSEYGVVDGDVSTNCTCGTANKDDQRIIGGEEAKPNEWPMIAEISADGDHFCGGTVVTKRHVITAAHCGFFPKTLDPLPYQYLSVWVGVHELTGETARNGGDYFSIEEFIAHPDYHYVGKMSDIAVILLDSEITYTKNVVPACLPVGNEKILGDKLNVLGWGVTKYKADATASVLMKVKIKAVEHERCKSVYEYYNTDTNICMHTKDKDACQGDSGGPLLWRDPETNRYTLVAVTSYGRKCGILPAVNANVSHFLPWIQSVISATDSTQRTCAKVTS